MWFLNKEPNLSIKKKGEKKKKWGPVMVPSDTVSHHIIKGQYDHTSGQCPTIPTGPEGGEYKLDLCCLWILFQASNVAVQCTMGRYNFHSPFFFLLLFFLFFHSGPKFVYQLRSSTMLHFPTKWFIMAPNDFEVRKNYFF